MKKTYQTGIQGEQRAAEWLCCNMGMCILENRFRTKAGEIDLIMLDGDTVVFVEVKTRLHALPGTGMLAVDRKKQQRIARAAYLYLLSRHWTRRPVRFDVAEVSDSCVIHVPNAFQPGYMFYGL